MLSRSTGTCNSCMWRLQVVVAYQRPRAMRFHANVAISTPRRASCLSTIMFITSHTDPTDATTTSRHTQTTTDAQLQRSTTAINERNDAHHTQTTTEHSSDQQQRSTKRHHTQTTTDAQLQRSTSAATDTDADTCDRPHVTLDNW